VTSEASVEPVIFDRDGDDAPRNFPAHVPD